MAKTELNQPETMEFQIQYADYGVLRAVSVQSNQKKQKEVVVVYSSLSLSPTSRQKKMDHWHTSPMGLTNCHKPNDFHIVTTSTHS